MNLKLTLSALCLFGWVTSGNAAVITGQFGPGIGASTVIYTPYTPEAVDSVGQTQGNPTDEAAQFRSLFDYSQDVFAWSKRNTGEDGLSSDTVSSDGDFLADRMTAFVAREDGSNAPASGDLVSLASGNTVTLAFEAGDDPLGWWYVNESEDFSPSRVVGFLLKGGQHSIWFDFNGDNSIGLDTLVTFNTIGYYLDELGIDQSGGTGLSHITLFGVAPTLTPVPVPAALPLLATALAGLGFMSWRRKRVDAMAA